MKNLNILPKTEVPIKLRKKIYKETLYIIENWNIEKTKYKCNSPSLCFFLIMVLYGSKVVLHEHPENHKEIFFGDTSIMFPELKLFLKKGWLADYTNTQRINFLKSVI